jgi:hypothetical protein
MADATKRVNPAVLPPLKEALTLAFWYKKDLRPFLASSLDDTALVAQLDWTDYKRNIVHQLVDTLAANQHRYFDQLVNLILSTADISDPQWLTRADDGQRKYDDAVGALKALQKLVEPLRKQRTEAEEADRRRKEEDARSAVQRAIREKLSELQGLLYDITSLEPQARGYALEKLLNQLFALFDIDAKSSFRIVGEQIDGAFTLEGTEYLMEARWRKEKASVADLDTFAGKIGRKLDNTLGLFLSINGFEESAVSTHSQSRPVLFLMEGSDLSAVLEDRIGLPELLSRKRQHAAHTGEVMISAYRLIE